MSVAANQQAPSWIDCLDPDRLRSDLDRPTVERGEAYQRQGRVGRHTVGRDGTVIVAHVRGSRSRSYTTTVRLDWPERVDGLDSVADDEIEWASSCTCPMAEDCKHVVAAILEVRGRGRAPVGSAPTSLPASRPTWEALLDPIVRPDHPAHAPQTTAAPLGILVELSQPRKGQGTPQPRLTLRPVAPGANGGWVRGGIGWHELDYGHRARGSNPEHRMALRAFQAWERSRSSPYSYGTSQAMQVDGLGPMFWRLLDDALAAGVSLVTGNRGQHQVRLARDPVTALLDLTRTSAGDMTLTARVTLPDVAGALHFIGSPPHGVVAAAGGGLVLARFAAPLEAHLAELVVQRGSVRVPATDVDRFLSRYYPALVQRATVLSTDGSVVLPEVLPPLLALRVSFEEDHRARLRWTFRYRVHGDAVDVPLLRDSVHDADAAAVPRDAAAEEELLASLDVLEAVSGLRIPKPGLTRLAVVVAPELAGMDTVRFRRDVLPVLEHRDDVEVTIEGRALTYSENLAPPVVSVSTRDPEPDDLFTVASTSDDGPLLDWFDLGIDVTVDGHPVPLIRLLAALATDEEHLILDNGTWFSLDLPQLRTLRRIVEEARALQDPESQTLRINRYQAGLWAELVELGVVAHQSERWARSVGALLALETVPHPDVPPGVEARLRQYQLDGFHWLSLLWDHQLGGILADDMGLGKTLQALVMAERARLDGTLTPDAPILVVAPTSVVSAWVREAAHFTPGLRVVALTETERRRGTTVVEATREAHVVVTSYALFRIDEAGYRARAWQGLILDEAQFVKNHHARTYAAARRLPAPFKLAITGTPLENSLMDLWALLSIVAPGLFPSPTRFSELFRKPIESGTSPELLETLRRRIRPLMLRRTKESVAPDLPPKIEQVVPVVLNPQHRRIYDRHLHRERQRILGLLDDVGHNRIAILRALTKLRQLSLDVHLVDPDAPATVRSSKVDALLDQLVEVVAEGHRCLVFSQFTSFLGMVRSRLADEGIEHVYLDGRTRDRPKRIAAFVEGSAPVFVISLKAGGSGLTLTEADYVFVLDPWWNPAVEAQAIDRAHRIGQDKTVMVYRLVSESTIEEKVLELQERKRELFARVVDDGGLMAAPLTADDIRGLLGAD